MCDHNDCALQWHFIEAPNEFWLHKIISDNARLISGRTLAKGCQILAIGPGRINVDSDQSFPVDRNCTLLRRNDSAQQIAGSEVRNRIAECMQWKDRLS